MFAGFYFATIINKRSVVSGGYAMGCFFLPKVYCIIMTQPLYIKNLPAWPFLGYIH